MRLVGRAVRATVIKPGETWRIPMGLARGIRMEVDPAAPLHVYIGTAEREITSYVRRFARPGSRCFDVGGHDACDAMALARLTGSEVISFEFDERSVVRMERNLALNSALASKIKILQTYVAHEATDSPKTDSLDRLIEMSNVFQPDFIKMDVEGAEAMALSGARTLLESRRPHLVIETHSDVVEGQCVDILRQAGYEPFVVNRRRWLREDRGGSHNRWLIAPGRTDSPPSPRRSPGPHLPHAHAVRE